MSIRKSGLVPHAVALAAIVGAAFCLHPMAQAQARSPALKAVLDKMDAASTKFTSAQADLRQELFTKVVSDTETRMGQIYFLRSGSSTQMGLRLLAPDAPLGSAPTQIVQFKDGKLQSLDTGGDQVDEFAASGKNQSTAETFMTLGFGGSGSDLEKAWTITDQGTEQMSDGGKQIQVEKLDLVSKDASIRNNYSHITIWVDPARDVSLKQESFEVSGDTRTVYYSNIRSNQTVNLAPFAIKCKSKCTVVTH